MPKLLELGPRRGWSSGVLSKEGSVMSRIDSSLWEVLGVKSLGHRRAGAFLDPAELVDDWTIFHFNG